MNIVCRCMIVPLWRLKVVETALSSKWKSLYRKTCIFILRHLFGLQCSPMTDIVNEISHGDTGVTRWFDIWWYSSRYCGTSMITPALYSVTCTHTALNGHSNWYQDALNLSPPILGERYGFWLSVGHASSMFVVEYLIGYSLSQPCPSVLSGHQDIVVTTSSTHGRSMPSIPATFPGSISW